MSPRGGREVWLVRTDPLGATVVRAGEDGPRTIELDAGGALGAPLLPGFALPMSGLED